MPVVDASPLMSVLHARHDYRHVVSRPPGVAHTRTHARRQARARVPTRTRPASPFTHSDTHRRLDTRLTHASATLAAVRHECPHSKARCAAVRPPARPPARRPRHPAGLGYAARAQFHATPRVRRSAHRRHFARTRRAGWQVSLTTGPKDPARYGTERETNLRLAQARPAYAHAPRLPPCPCSCAMHSPPTLPWKTHAPATSPP